jgi:hypothetical protein
VHPWRRRQPELAAEAGEITFTLLVVENELELADEITAKLRALHANAPVRDGDGSWMCSSRT